MAMNYRLQRELIKQLMHLIKYMNKVKNTLTKKNEEVINTYVAGRTLTKNSTKPGV